MRDFFLLLLGVSVLYTVEAIPMQSAEETSAKCLVQIGAPGPGPRDLAWDGSYLWNVDDITDMVYKLNPVSGEVVHSFPAPGPEPRGLTWDGSSLWVSDDSTKMIYMINPSTGEVMDFFDAPLLEPTGESPPLGGLSWDGTYLWSGFSAGFSSRMNQVVPGSGEVLQFQFTRGYPQSLASDGTTIWNATDNGGLRTGLLYEYDIATGNRVTDYELPCFFPAGLAFDGQFMWCVDRIDLTIYKLSIGKELGK
jgi:streptogramin lyase